MCCHPKSITPHTQGSFDINCNTLYLEDCILNDDICSWDCNPTHSQQRNTVLTNAGYIKKTFKRIAKGNGIFEDASFVGEEPPISHHEEPTTIDEVIQFTKLISVDECGVEYEYEMDTISAATELDRLHQKEQLLKQEQRKRDSKSAKSADFNHPNTNHQNQLLSYSFMFLSHSFLPYQSDESVQSMNNI